MENDNLGYVHVVDKPWNPSKTTNLRLLGGTGAGLNWMMFQNPCLFEVAYCTEHFKTFHKKSVEKWGCVGQQKITF